MVPPILQYVNLVKQHKGHRAKPVQDFVKTQRQDKVLTQRIETVTKLMGLKQLLK